VTYPEYDYFECGQVRGKANESGYTKTNLDNNMEYAVAVAAVDIYGNEGTKSAPACGIPVEVDTFFENYRSSGGTAGGTFCNISYGRKSLLSAGFLLLSLGAIASLRRRRADQN
jgi:hypothetical protein